jgi:hypothetical protein
MSAIRDAVMAIDVRVSRSTFGRVFRLDGSGHVSSVRYLEIRRKLTSYSLNSEKAPGSSRKLERD